MLLIAIQVSEDACVIKGIFTFILDIASKSTNTIQLFQYSITF